MEHVTHEQMVAHVLDGIELSADVRAHLEHCSACQAELSGIATLARELTIARQSQPSRETTDAYYSLYRGANAGKKSLQQAWNWIAATLVFDSRTQALAMGTRSVRADSYRLLFNAEHADLELFVESDGLARRIQGDLMLLGDDADASTTLVQLQETENSTVISETRPDADGRFQFGSVPPGTYNLLLTGTADEMLEVSELDIT